MNEPGKRMPFFGRSSSLVYPCSSRKQPETISYRLAEGGSSRHSELAECRDFLDKEIRPDPNLWTKSQHNEQLVANALRRNIRARPTPHSTRKERPMNEPELDLSKTYDVIVVGSGAAGGMAAHVLTSHGLQVLLFEAGKKLNIEKEL